MTRSQIPLSTARPEVSTRCSRRAARALVSAAAVTALCCAYPASGVVNSFFPGVTFASLGADWGTASNWSLGHVPGQTADLNEEIVIPAGGGTGGMNTMTFNGGNIFADSILHVGSLGRVLVNNSASATPDTITLSGFTGK